MLSDVIAGFSTGTYAVTRTVSPTYGLDGRLVAGSTSVVNIDASIQPFVASKINPLPEGYHVSGLRKMWAQQELFGGGVGGNAPDIVLIRSEEWEVLHVDDFEAFGVGSGGDHWEATIARKTTP